MNKTKTKTTSTSSVKVSILPGDLKVKGQVPKMQNPPLPPPKKK